ncbi:DUF397 domain-containing protein [Nocardiopsis alba]|jgi:hypothetical protein|uniref:DUF397 domain-containing protein n=1 Tax=Nocardiopsis alba TaxID=53437 RepID=UPI0033DAC005
MKKWHKSSYSGGDGGNCVEVAEGTTTSIRDSQNKEQGQLSFNTQEWDAFLIAVAD